jgi:hypothetical protein
MTCWICGGEGTTGEHLIKRSDLKAVFGTPSQSIPLFYNDKTRRDKHIGSLNAPILKSDSKICEACNSSRTQIHDQAWEQLSNHLRTRLPEIQPGTVLRTNRIFTYKTSEFMRNVHLYFVKVFGCHINSLGIPIDLDLFSKSILNNIHHPDIYLRFGCKSEVDSAGLTDVWTAQVNGTCSFATWFYEVGQLRVNVMYAVDGEKRDGLLGAWHPRLGTNKLIMSGFV